VAILASSLTYYYASLNLPTVTTTMTSTTTVTSVTTATQSVTTTETSTVTTTKYVTLSPSVTTITLTMTPATTPPSGKVITVPRNDTVAQRLVGFRLKQHLLTAIITWLTWLESRSGTPSPIFHNDPAAALATLIITRLTSQDVVALPPLTSTYGIELIRSPISIYPPQSLSNTTCAPINVGSSAAGAVSAKVVLEPINSSAMRVETVTKPSIGGSITSKGVVVVGKGTVKVVAASNVTSIGGTTTPVRLLEVFRDDIPVVAKTMFGNLTHEESINASNGALIIKMSGSTIKVVEGVEPALRKILKSLNITVTYDGTAKLAGNLIVPVYRVFMTGDIRVKVENTTFAVKLSYSGLAYLIGNNVAIFMESSVNDLHASVVVNGDVYCRYLKEPVETHVKVTSVSVS